ncbi:hypothetical protein B0H14DRAFT_1175011 [Mycena olivaceomarginata]|nr:hypothetical protein B0H14DRAFT_1175011 [Mycena olivaceomarginata]
MGDVDLLNEIRVDHTGNLYRGQGSVPVRRIYKARIEEKQSDMTVFVHRGDRAEEEWKREIERCSRFRHPNLAQLYGTVNSSGFYATIFHDELVPFHAYIEKYRDSPLSTVYLYAYFAAELYNAHEEFRSLFALACTSEWDALIRANAMFRQPPLWIRRSTGRPCVKYHPTSSVDRNAINGVVLQDLDTPLSDLGRHPERTLISLLSLHNYHHICEKYLSKAVVTSASGAAIRAGAIMLYPGSEFEVEIAHADGWARPLWGWRSHVHEYGLVMESGWTRCRADSYTRWNADGQINLPDPWLSQAHHVFTQSPYTANYEEYAFVYEIVYSVRCAYSPQTTSEGYLFLCPMDDLLSENGAFIVPKCFAYWSLDPEGNGRLTPDQASQLGFPAVQLERKVQYLRWDEQVYAGLSQFHAGKGFNPTSQDVARDIGFALYQLSHLPNVESAHGKNHSFFLHTCAR